MKILCQLGNTRRLPRMYDVFGPRNLVTVDIDQTAFNWEAPSGVPYSMAAGFFQLMSIGVPWPKTVESIVAAQLKRKVKHQIRNFEIVFVSASE